MTKNKLKQFTVSAKLDLLVSVEVTARSLDEALEKSKSLKVQDFVDVDGDYLDGEMEITGIY
jgi:hypothetical protein